MVDDEAKTQDDLKTQIAHLQEQMNLLMVTKKENVKTRTEKRTDRLEKAYGADPDITANQLKKKAAVGSVVATAFLKMKRG